VQPQSISEFERGRAFERSRVDFPSSARREITPEQLWEMGLGHVFPMGITDDHLKALAARINAFFNGEK